MATTQPIDLAKPFALLIEHHLLTCGKDHLRSLKQVGLVQFEPIHSILTCKACNAQKILTMRLVDIPAEDFALECHDFICLLLTEQQEFFDTHFLTCVFPGGPKQ